MMRFDAKGIDFIRQSQSAIAKGFIDRQFGQIPVFIIWQNFRNHPRVSHPQVHQHDLNSNCEDNRQSEEKVHGCVLFGE